MKLIIDVEKDYYEMIKYNVEHGQEYKPFEIIANGIPYEPKGEWIEVGDNQPYSKDKLYGCSKCRFGGYLLSDTKNVNFCPNCGAKMKGGDEE